MVYGHAFGSLTLPLRASSGAAISIDSLASYGAFPSLTRQGTIKLSLPGYDYPTQKLSVVSRMEGMETGKPLDAFRDFIKNEVKDSKYEFSGSVELHHCELTRHGSLSDLLIHETFEFERKTGTAERFDITLYSRSENAYVHLNFVHIFTPREQ